MLLSAVLAGLVAAWEAEAIREPARGLRGCGGSGAGALLSAPLSPGPGGAGEGVRGFPRKLEIKSREAGSFL